MYLLKLVHHRCLRDVQLSVIRPTYAVVITTSSICHPCNGRVLVCVTCEQD